MKSWIAMERTHPRILALFVLVLGLLITFLAYLPGLDGAFFFDDAPNITGNPSVRLIGFSWESLQLAWSGGRAGQFGRPVSQLSFALNYYFAGYDPWAYKLTNLTIHCVNGVLVYFLSIRLLRSFNCPGGFKERELISAVLASVWLLHPIQLTSVLYVAQRMTSLSALFVLAALLLHVTARQATSGWRSQVVALALAWGLFWPLGILSKESAILAPGFVAAYELTLGQSERGRLDAFGRLCLLLVVVAAAGVVPYLISPFGQSALSGYEIRSFSLTERLLTESRVIWAYIGWIVFPNLDSLALFHDDFVVSTSLTNPLTTLAAVLALIGLVAIALHNARRRPLISFGIFWFLVGHALESTFIPLELVHEHRNYLPLLGILLLPVGWLSSMAAMPGQTRTLALTLVSAALLYAGFVTTLRADMYSNELRRTQIESQAHPNSARGHYSAGRILTGLADDGGNIVAAVLAGKHFEMATQADSDYKMGLFGQIVLSCGLSQSPDLGAIDELARRFRERLILQEDTSILMAIVEMSGAGRLCLTRGQIDGLFSAFFENPKVSAYMKMTMYSLQADYLWLNQRDLPAAREALRQSLVLAPENPSLRLKWAQLDYISGETAAAKRLLLELREQPFAPEERETLTNLLNRLPVDGN